MIFSSQSNDSRKSGEKSNHDALDAKQFNFVSMPKKSWLRNSLEVIKHLQHRIDTGQISLEFLFVAASQTHI